MKLSRETEYGLTGLVHLVQQPEGTVMRPAEIFQKLTQYGLVRSLRGTTRGYTLNKPADDISFREVLELREGPGLLNGVSLGSTAALRRIPVSPRGMETDYPQANGVDGGDRPSRPRAPDCDSANTKTGLLIFF